ncbi:hypothetical protein B7463_g5040, partial [Scytalidium lignicola]
MSQSRYRSVNPSNGQLVQVFLQLTDEEVLAALDVAQNTFTRDWGRREVLERSKLMAKAAALMRERLEELATLDSVEMGKPIGDARYEVALSADILDYYAKNGEEFLKTIAIPDVPGSVIVTQPLGVILAIEPWNFPYYQIARVAGPQLVAGNVLIVKHASNVPRCALAIAKLFDDAGFPQGVYTNVFASLAGVNLLIDDFRVRGVTLTGSEKAGITVAERAGRQLKKVVLELGGSDPCIILPDAPLDHAITQATLGRIYNTGQTCVAVKRIIVIGKERGKQVLEGLEKKLSELRAGDPTDESTTLGPLSSEGGLNDLLKQIESAKAHGAKVVVGGKRIERPGFYLEPTIITDISHQNPLFLEETFGPVISYYVVDTEDEAISLANATKFGLGSFIFGSDTKHAQEVAERIEAGVVFINSSIYFDPALPFGGTKNSGFGRECSELGITEFVNKKMIRVAGQ